MGPVLQWDEGASLRHLWVPETVVVRGPEVEMAINMVMSAFSLLAHKWV